MDIAKFLLNKEFTFNNPVTLFEPELWRAKDRICPFCLNKLYEMRSRPFLYCKSKKHKNRFIISKDKSNATPS